RSREEGLASDVLHDQDGALAHERDGHRLGAHAVARGPGSGGTIRHRVCGGSAWYQKTPHPRRERQARTRAASCGIEKGLVRESVLPRSKPAGVLTSSSRAVNTRTGSAAVAGLERSTLSTSKPPCFGMSRSSTRRSGVCTSINASASWPVEASLTMWPSWLRAM